MDYFLIFDKTKHEYRDNLYNLMQRFTDHDATLNKAKCVVDVTAVEFLGHWITPDGILLEISYSQLSIYRTVKGPTNLFET